MSISKYAFLPVHPGEIEGERLDFAEAQKLLAEMVKPDKVEAWYEQKRQTALDSHDPELYPEYGKSWKPFNQLEPHRIGTEAWIFAGEILLSSLGCGGCDAYVSCGQPLANFLVPRMYWETPGLSIPHASKLNLNGPDWIESRKYHGCSFFMIKTQVEKLLGLSAKGREKTQRAPVTRGPKCKYDWISFNSELFSQLDFHGLPSIEDPEWKNQAMVEKLMEIWCQKNWGETSTPCESSIRARVAEGLRRFKADKAS